MNHSRKAHIVGVGETEYTKWGKIGDITEHALALKAIITAVTDAGLNVSDIDGMASFAEDRNEAIFLSAELGIPELRFANMVWMPGGGGGCAAVSNAAMAVETGQAEVVVVYRSLCQGQYMRFGHAAELVVNTAQAQTPVNFSQANTLMFAAMGQVMPFGMLTGAAAFALPFRRHMHKYGTTSEQLGKIAVTFREHANRNPRAVMKDKTLTLEQHQQSRMIADPFRLFDCCMENDGACAVIITTEERAKDLAPAKNRKLVEIVATVQGTPKGYGFGSFTNANIADEIYASGGTEKMANRLWHKADMKPSDVDVAQIYDHFTGSVLMQIEDFGFCKRGEGGGFIDSGALSWNGGSLPTNTSGGSLSEAYMHGLNHVLEGARLLWGESCCLVPDAKVCLVTSAAGVPSSALVLRAH